MIQKKKKDFRDEIYLRQYFFMKNLQVPSNQMPVNALTHLWRRLYWILSQWTIFGTISDIYTYFKRIQLYMFESKWWLKTWREVRNLIFLPLYLQSYIWLAKNTYLKDFSSTIILMQHNSGKSYCKKDNENDCDIYIVELLKFTVVFPNNT